MADDPRRPGSRREDYRSARIAVALTLALVIGALLILDAILDAYEIQPATLITIGTMILALLGLEVKDVLTKGE